MAFCEYRKGYVDTDIDAIDLKRNQIKNCSSSNFSKCDFFIVWWVNIMRRQMKSTVFWPFFLSKQCKITTNIILAMTSLPHISWFLEAISIDFLDFWSCSKYEGGLWCSRSNTHASCFGMNFRFRSFIFYFDWKLHCIFSSNTHIQFDINK